MTNDQLSHWLKFKTLWRFRHGTSWNRHETRCSIVPEKHDSKYLCILDD